MVYKIPYIVLLCILLASVSFVKADSDTENTAISEAVKWLAEVDEGQYEESWENSAEFFQNAVKKGQWVQSLQVVRKPLGNLVSRELKNSTYKTSLPGAPDGQYVVIQFKTSFENKKSAIETVTPMMDKDGNWRVSGYYIN
jgi:hypothetical protein